MFFNASAAAGDRSPSLDLPALQISLTRCPSLQASNIPSAAPRLCTYPGFGEIPIATGCRHHLGIHIAELICTILATFKWLRPKERVCKNKVLLLYGWLWVPFTLSTQQFLSLRFWVEKSSSTTWSWESCDYSQEGALPSTKTILPPIHCHSFPQHPFTLLKTKGDFLRTKLWLLPMRSFTFFSYEVAKVSSKLWMTAPKRS